MGVSLLFGGVAFAGESGVAGATAETTVTCSEPTPTPPSSEVGVGGVATPPGAITLTANRSSKLSITSGGTATNPKVYDGKGFTVRGGIYIDADYVTIQNYRVDAQQQYGIYSNNNTGVTIRNNDIKNLKPSGDGDMNGITFFGNNTKILFNTAVDMVASGADTSESHTDFIQTWVSSSHPTASSNVEIRGNVATGPANPDRDEDVPSIHQWLMVEDYGRGGNSGGSKDGMKNWLVIGNTMGDSWNQAIKNDGVDNMTVTKNKFIGSSNRVMHQANGSGLKFYSDNEIGPGYGSIGVPVTAGAGPV